MAGQRERSRSATLEAAWALYAERGYAALTIEGIAARAGVGKTTIYRWWPDKAAVLLDALTGIMDTAIAFPDTGDVHADFRTQMLSLLELWRGTTGRAYLSLVAASTDDAGIAAALRDRLIAARREASIRRLRASVARGELAATLDLDLVVDTLYGALYYNAMVAHVDMDTAYVDRLLTQHLDPMTGRR